LELIIIIIIIIITTTIIIIIITIFAENFGRNRKQTKTCTGYKI